MGIMERFKDIMAANINALLDKAEDPEKMIDQYMRNLQSDLGKVKAETASVIAEESRAKRALDECNANITKMQTYAEKPLPQAMIPMQDSFWHRKRYTQISFHLWRVHIRLLLRMLQRCAACTISSYLTLTS